MMKWEKCGHSHGEIRGMRLTPSSSFSTQIHFSRQRLLPPPPPAAVAATAPDASLLTAKATDA